MALKRKRSSSELCSSPSSSSASSTSSSPPRNNPFAMFSLSMSGPAHLDSRTLKRFRNSRPADEEVHHRTLGLLYSAQHRPSELQQVLEQDESAPATPTPGPVKAAQQSLHRFWNINSAPRASPAVVERSITCASNCEDCGERLADGEGGMDIDGDVEQAACSACGKNVCFSCSVSNLGEQKRCLQCAGRNVSGGHVGWTSADFPMPM